VRRRNRCLTVVEGAVVLEVDRDGRVFGGGVEVEDEHVVVSVLLEVDRVVGLRKLCRHAPTAISESFTLSEDDDTIALNMSWR
jgi:hypothetical protein